uniref:Leucine-rich repeat-containing N-terminal plant-type domain-containing protein n=1 Tax=Populus alba TaxID=43335 RepID=A0A4U5Q4F0_POPAL|nr:hypothetical protein D5086_0000140880 [Populus alba]
MVWSLLWMFGGREDWSLEIQSLIDPYRIYLRDWVDGSNCCEWRGDRAGLVGCMENEGFQVLSSKLSNLDLSINQFNDKSILSCFNGNLSTLKSLDLSGNGLTAGSGSFYGLKVLSSRLKKLENLHLRWNQYNDSIFPSLTGFSSLKSLDLSYNQLTGSGFQLQPMRLGKLENLDLSGNQLNSSILSILSGLSSLKSLDLSHNKLTGSINSFQLQPVRLGKLENLDLSWNQCNDSIFPSLTGFSSLKSLDLSGNEMTGSGIIHSFYLNASHDILLIILFLYQQK